MKRNIRNGDTTWFVMLMQFKTEATKSQHRPSTHSLYWHENYVRLSVRNQQLVLGKLLFKCNMLLLQVTVPKK